MSAYFYPGPVRSGFFFIFKYMNKYTDLTICSDAVYQLADMIASGKYANILVYEIHEYIKDPSSISKCYEGLEEFQKRSDEYYEKTFISDTIVDDEPAAISVVVKIADEWFVCHKHGFNFYIGYGPGSILSLREACFKNGIKIFVVSRFTLKKWLKNTFGKLNSESTSISKENGYKKEFNDITKVFSDYFKDVQNRRNVFINIEEEKLRDIMLPALNTIFKGRVNGEAKSASGKTDILIKTSDHNNEYIFELKLWNGIKSFIEAKAQLRSYLAHHHNFSGIVIFSKNKKFEDVISQVMKHLKDECEIPPRKFRNNEYVYRFQMSYDDGNDKKIDVHVLFVNLA